jgi:hypothetical protein
LSEAEKQQLLAKGEPLTFGHTMEEQIGGQLEATFMIIGFYEDRHQGEALARYTATYIATRAVRPAL